MEVAISRTQYWIPRDVYFCRTEDGTIFMDLAREKYLAINQEGTTALEWAISVLPTLPHGESDQLLQADIAELERLGLLTQDAAGGRRHTSAALPPPDIQRSMIVLERAPSVKLHHVTNFLRAFLWAQWVLRAHPLKNITERLGRMASTEGDSELESQLQRSEDLYAIFNRLRTLIFAGANKCLLLAIALRVFMNSYGLSPHLIIGVSSDPFHAHSWLQMGPLIFDVRPEALDLMTPIFCI